MSTERNPAAERFAATLVAARRARGLSQPKLARLAGMDRSAITRLEYGKRLPNGETLCKLAAALDLSVADLLDPPKKRTRRKAA